MGTRWGCKEQMSDLPPANSPTTEYWKVCNGDVYAMVKIYVISMQCSPFLCHCWLRASARLCILQATACATFPFYIQAKAFTGPRTCVAYWPKPNMCEALFSLTPPRTRTQPVYMQPSPFTTLHIRLQHASYHPSPFPPSQLTVNT